MKTAIMALELEMAWRNYNLSRTAFYQAQQNFELAEAEYVDMAIEELSLAEQKMDAALRKFKTLKGEMEGVAI